MVAHAFNSSTQETETGRPITRQPDLHSKDQESQDYIYIVRLWLKTISAFVL